MITNPASDIVLDEAQSKKIEVAGHKLSVIETEVVIANRNLKVLKDDIVKATLEHKELEEKIGVLTASVEAKKKEKAELDAVVAELAEKVEKSRKELEEREDALSRKECLLSVREEEIATAESNLSELIAVNTAGRVSLEKERKEIESVKEAFDAVTLPWK